MKVTKPVVFIICTGLGHINRGYESFTRECFESLKESPEFDLYLLKGGGKDDFKELKISCCRRNFPVASFCAKLLNKDPYWVEQLTFLAGMLPALIKYRPAVIYYSDFILGTWLWHIRKRFGFKFKLLFSNGAPNKPPFTRMDHVQQLLPVYLHEAIQYGTSATMQTLLPYGFDIDVRERSISISKKALIREELNFDPGQKIILSVGAVNSHQKRMDYLIKEVAFLPKEYYLVVLGQFSEETAIIKELASQLIPDRYSILNVDYEQVKKYYASADYFVLASLSEGFGRVLIEALSYGLPCIVHDYINAKQVLNKYGVYIDMNEKGSLVSLLKDFKTMHSPENLIDFAHENYSWNKLKSKYGIMISNLIN